MLTPLTLALLQGGDEAVVAQAAVPLPVVDRGGPLAEYALYTGKVDPKAIEAAIGKALGRRPGWTHDASSWRYSSMRRGLRLPYLTVAVLVRRGRAMPQKDARPQRGTWTTVDVEMDHRGSGSYAMPHPEWVIVTDIKEDAAVNVPRGEEINLAKIVGLPLVAHKSTYGEPWWVFTGPEPRATVEARVARTLSGRRGWNPAPSSGWRNGRSFHDTNWAYLFKAPFPKDHLPADRALFLAIQDGKASPTPLKTPLRRPWTTVTVVGQGTGFTRVPVGIWNAYP